ncbi:hypothetical protein MASR1M68_05830 [Elusimicrobiota bacterium]
MTRIDRIIKNVNATMSMANMPITTADKKRIERCLQGKQSFDDAVSKIVKKYFKLNI